MKNLIIAKRYAKALFNLAQEEGKIEQYGEELEGLVQLFEANPDLANCHSKSLVSGSRTKSNFFVDHR